jgi:hypothetical protein
VIGLQEQVTNHRKRLWSKALVVSTKIDAAWAQTRFPDSFKKLVGEQTADTGTAVVRDLITGIRVAANRGGIMGGAKRHWEEMHE